MGNMLNFMRKNGDCTSYFQTTFRLSSLEIKIFNERKEATLNYSVGDIVLYLHEVRQHINYKILIWNLVLE